MTAFYIIAGLLAVFGILIHKFKFYFLIAGYNMMSKEEKEEYNASSMGKHVGLSLYFLSGPFLDSRPSFPVFSNVQANRKTRNSSLCNSYNDCSFNPLDKRK